jgi:hypothetical protein
LKRDGSCGEFLEAALEVSAGEAPAEGARVEAVLSSEAEDASGQLAQAGGGGRGQHLALEDAEEDLDLGEPGGMDGSVD